MDIQNMKAVPVGISNCWRYPVNSKLHNNFFFFNLSCGVSQHTLTAGQTKKRNKRLPQINTYDELCQTIDWLLQFSFKCISLAAQIL